MLDDYEFQMKIAFPLSEEFKDHINSVKYAKLTKCSHDTALPDIHDLLAKELLVKNDGGGRSTSYRLVEIDPIL